MINILSPLRLLPCVSWVLSVALLAPAAVAADFILLPSEDALIRGGRHATEASTDTVLAVASRDRDGLNDVRKTLLSFDVDSVILRKAEAVRLELVYHSQPVIANETDPQVTPEGVGPINYNSSRIRFLTRLGCPMHN